MNMLNNDTDPTFDVANIPSETKDALHTTSILEIKFEPLSPKTQESHSSMMTNEHNYTLSQSEARQKLERELRRKEILIRNLRKECAKYKKRTFRLEDSVRNLKCEMSKAKEKYQIGEHLLRKLNNNLSNIMLEILSRASGEHNNTEYSKALKRFALSVYFYSPAAYRYLRECFKKSIPHENMIRRWRTAAYVTLSPNAEHGWSTGTLSSDVENPATLTQNIDDGSSDLENQTIWPMDVVNQSMFSNDTASLSRNIEDTATLLPDRDEVILPHDTEN